MSRVCRIDLDNRATFDKRLSEFLNHLRNDPRVEAVWLFGSVARGDYHEGSDIDLLVIGHFPGRLVDRIVAVMTLTDLPVEPLVYTPEEFQAMREAGNPLIESVLTTGRAA